MIVFVLCGRSGRRPDGLLVLRPPSKVDSSDTVMFAVAAIRWAKICIDEVEQILCRVDLGRRWKADFGEIVEDPGDRASVADAPSRE